MLKKWIKFSLLWLGLIALVLFHYVTGITPLILRADTFDSYENYSEYVVSDFNDYDTIVNANTPNVQYYVRAVGEFDYSVSYCPLNGIVGQVAIVNQVGYVDTVWQSTAYTQFQTLDCIEPIETYHFDVTLPVSLLFDMTDRLFNVDDDLGVIFNTYIQFKPSVASYGYTFTIDNYLMKTWLEVDFNNNYLMSTFLLDSDFQGSWYSSSGRIARPFVLYAISGNDTYNVYNNELNDVANRYKYAVEIPSIDTAIVVQKMGTGWETAHNNPVNFTMSSSSLYFSNKWWVYGFNAAPMKTPFDDVAIDTTPNYSVCDYVLGFPIDCTLDGVPIGSFQAMANDLWEWTIKESPIFSDVWTLASGGFQWLSNTFQFLGYFDVDSLLGGILALLIGVIVMLWAWVGG